MPPSEKEKRNRVTPLKVSVFPKAFPYFYFFTEFFKPFQNTYTIYTDPFCIFLARKI